MNALQTHFWAVRDYLSPVLRESKFKEHGRITPDEFVAAGDFLSYKFPTWQWCAGDSTKAREYLPKDKQFLISRGVPSLRRVSQIEKGAGVCVKEDDEKLMSFAVDGDDEGGKGGDDDQWVATHFDHSAGPSSGKVEIADIPDIEQDPSAPSNQLTEGQEDDLAARVAGLGVGRGGGKEARGSVGAIRDEIPDIGDIPDMDDEIDNLGAGVEEEEDAATHQPTMTTKPLGATAGDASTQGSTANHDGGKLLSVRKYDCIITYDKYYQTPRMWLVGYDEHGVPLKPSQIFEDVSSDYAQKTVTIEPFPHGHAGPDGSGPSSSSSTSSSAGVATASIHPCKHASVMKKVIERMNASVVEEQRKAKEGGAGGGAAAANAADKDKKKKKGWGISGAVRKVTGATAGLAPSDKGGEAGATGATGTATCSTSPSGDGSEETTEVEGLRVDQYMIIFLKFMASIVPAIEIDATQAV